eukprot:713323-Amorphochlora_amoeboformis.AAC.1
MSRKIYGTFSETKRFQRQAGPATGDRNCDDHPFPCRASLCCRRTFTAFADLGWISALDRYTFGSRRWEPRAVSCELPDREGCIPRGPG